MEKLRMATQEQPTPPLTASRRAQIRQILSEYGDKQVRASNGRPEASTANDGTPGGSGAHINTVTNGHQDERSDVIDTMEKLRRLIPDSTPTICVAKSLMDLTDESCRGIAVIDITTSSCAQ
jgi:hypothetical protein